MVIAAALAVGLAGAAGAQEIQRPVPEIENTIRSQIDAFLAEDVDTAFSFASPGIQGMFQTPENFGRMVRDGYPMVWAPDDLRFGDLREQGGALWQRVIVTDEAGRQHALDYRMEQVAGVWRIAGVQFVRLPEVTA